MSQALQRFGRERSSLALVLELSRSALLLRTSRHSARDEYLVEGTLQERAIYQCLTAQRCAVVFARRFSEWLTTRKPGPHGGVDVQRHCFSQVVAHMH